MVTLNDCKQINTHDYLGWSTDTKPTDAGINSLLLELDTGKFFYFDGEEWKVIGWKVVGQ